jgi:hypothetical protein
LDDLLDNANNKPLPNVKPIMTGLPTETNPKDNNAPATTFNIAKRA